MAIDGVFLHYLIKEIKPQIINKRIHKIICINDHDYLFVLPQKQKLFITLNPSGAHFRMTKAEYLNSQTSLSPFLKRHLEGGVITDISQYHNDRIITISINRTDDLGYYLHYKLILELMGKNSNLIVTDENYLILECLKKSFNEERIIHPKATYEYLDSQKENPFLLKHYQGQSLEGVSKLLLHEINYINNLQGVINRKVNPTIIENEKIHFYIFDLYHLGGSRTHYSTISEMLEEYFIKKIAEISQNNEQKRLRHYIERELKKLKQKLVKQQTEMEIARKNLHLQEVANVLASNIHLVKPHQEEITVHNFYTNQNITIKLRTDISPTENINYYFNKYKKAKRTIEHLEKTIENTKAEIEYFNVLQKQADFSNFDDLNEILIEVGMKKPQKRKPKINLLTYVDHYGNIIWVGKNNLQNEYLTFTVAQKNDYFFHVQGYPGCHVILRGNLNDQSIKLAATIAATHSKVTASVPVDYTQVKWVKKIKGQKGSFVTYTKEKSVFAEADFEYINRHANLHK